MKLPLVALLAAVIATPVVSFQTPAEAQVLTGRGAPRSAPPQRPRLTEADLDRLTAAEDIVFEMDSQIENIRMAAEQAGGLTQAQQAEIDALTRRRAEAQAIVDRIEAKRNR